MHQWIPWADQLVCSFAEKNLGILVDIRLSVRQQCALVHRRHMPGLHYEMFCQQVKGSDAFPLLSTGTEAIPVGLCRVLSSPVRETWTHWRKDSKDTLKRFRDRNISPVRKG